MYDNIGGKIKGVAKTIATIGIAAWIIIGIIIWVVIKGFLGFIIAIFAMSIGSLLSWLGTFILYGFGELIEKASSIDAKLATINSRGSKMMIKENTIEHKEAVKEVNKMKNEYQKTIDEQEAVEKEFEKSKISFFNAVYNLSSNIRCVDITITDRLSYLTAFVTAKSYGKRINNLKVRLLIKDTNGERFAVQDLILGMKSYKDDIWTSEDTQLIMSQSVMIEDIVDVDVFVEEVIWEDSETEIIDEKQNLLIENAKDISSLRKIIGVDIVTPYTESVTNWQCYCGKRNELSDDICQRCGRDRRNFSDLGNVEVLLEKLKECKTLLEAKELFVDFEDLLGCVLAEKVNEQIDKDMYIKKLYGISDEKNSILKYTELIVKG